MLGGTAGRYEAQCITDLACVGTCRLAQGQPSSMPQHRGHSCKRAPKARLAALHGIHQVNGSARQCLLSSRSTSSSSIHVSLVWSSASGCRQFMQASLLGYHASRLTSSRLILLRPLAAQKRLTLWPELVPVYEHACVFGLVPMRQVVLKLHCRGSRQMQSTAGVGASHGLPPMPASYCRGLSNLHARAAPHTQASAALQDCMPEQRAASVVAVLTRGDKPQLRRGRCG